MSMTIFHNPRCSKSRAALELLESTGQPITIIRYLDQPPTEEELTTILTTGGLKAADVVRREESLYRELGLADASEEELIAAMAAHPKLINRPLVIRDSDGRAALGRPLEAVRALLDDETQPTE